MRERAQKRSGDPNPFESDRTRIKQKTGQRERLRKEVASPFGFVISRID